MRLLKRCAKIIKQGTDVFLEPAADPRQGFPTPHLHQRNFVREVEAALIETRAFSNQLRDRKTSLEKRLPPLEQKARQAVQAGHEDLARLALQRHQAYAKEIDVTMFATAFDFNSADFLAELDMPAFKLASGDLKNIPLLTHIARFQKPMILSTGGGTMEDVNRAYDAVMPINQQLCLLQCTAGYPAEFDELNLRVITTFRERFADTTVGLSSHDNGIAMAVAAYMLGARVIEKHFTLNHTWKGTDHAFSLEPIGFRKMVRDLNRVKVAMGDGVKQTYESEVTPIIKMGKKLVAARDLPAGHTIRREDIAIKSPGDGLQPYEIDKVIGRVTRHDVRADDDITIEVLNGAENWSKVAS